MQVWTDIVEPYVTSHPELNEDVSILSEDLDEVDDIWNALASLTKE